MEQVGVSIKSTMGKFRGVQVVSRYQWLCSWCSAVWACDLTWSISTMMDTMTRPGAGSDATDGDRHYPARLSRVTRHTASHEQHYTPGDGGCVLVTNSLISLQCNMSRISTAPIPWTLCHHVDFGPFSVVIANLALETIEDCKKLCANNTSCSIYTVSCFTNKSLKLSFPIAILDSHWDFKRKLCCQSFEKKCLKIIYVNLNLCMPCDHMHIVMVSSTCKHSHLCFQMTSTT